MQKPRLRSPGPAGYQRYNATQFDPYPLPDMGPEIVGGRPLDFAVPPSEVDRARQYDPSGLGRGAVVMPVPAAARPATPLY